MNFLTYNQIIAAAAETRNGCITRLGYATEIPTSKAWAALGFRAYKLTETTVRLGVDYNNIASVKARKAEESGSTKTPRANNFAWVLHNKVKYNSNTGKTYLQVATFNGGHSTRNQFLVYDPSVGWNIFEKAEWELSEYYLMTDPKYRSKHSGAPEIYTVSFDKIFKLGKTLA